MILEETPYEIVHSMNPVRFRISGIAVENLVKVQIATFSISGGIIPIPHFDTVYTGSYIPDNNGEVSFEISDVLHTVVQSLDVVQDEMIYPVDGMIKIIAVLIQEIQGLDAVINQESIGFQCLYGGVSHKALRYLHANGQNIFQYRLKNYARQFLFTTRTNFSKIHLRESELHPFYFIVPEGTLSVRAQGTSLNIPHLLPAGSIAAINPAMIAESLQAQSGNKISSFDILLNARNIFTIAIEENAKSVQRHILRFRNSLGCYEQIEVVGRGEISPEFDEEQLYGVYDSITEDFVENRMRRIYNDVINVSAGWKFPEELNFIRELLSSDDVYLLDSEIGKQKVIVSSDNFSMQLKPFSPQTVDISIRISDREWLITPTFNFSDNNDNRRLGWFEFGYLLDNGDIFSNAPINTI